MAYQDIGLVAKGAGAISPAWPGHQSGDIALLVVETANEAITLSDPQGFAEVTNSPQSIGTGGSAGGVRLGVYWCRATSGAMSAPTIADSGNHQVAFIVTFRGNLASGDPVDVTAGDTSAASTTVTMPSVTTTVANCDIVLCLAHDRDLNNTANVDSWSNATISPVERSDESVNTGVGGGIAIATGIMASAGATGTTSATLAASEEHARLTVALKPAAATAHDGSGSSQGTYASSGTGHKYTQHDGSGDSQASYASSGTGNNPGQTKEGGGDSQGSYASGGTALRTMLGSGDSQASYASSGTGSKGAQTKTGSGDSQASYASSGTALRIMFGSGESQGTYSSGGTALRVMFASGSSQGSYSSGGTGSHPVAHDGSGTSSTSYASAGTGSGVIFVRRAPSNRPWLRLPQTPDRYDAKDQTEMRRALEQFATRALMLPTAPTAITGSRAGNDALAEVLAALEAHGIIVDRSTA